MHPLVSVTVCLHNGLPYITRALQSVFAQTLQSFEIVLVDDGSSDGGADLVARRFQDSRLQLIRQENQGLGAARNVATGAARGPFVAFLDQDDEWVPEKLERQLEVFHRRPEAGLVFTDCVYIDENGQATGLATEHFGLETIDFHGENGESALLSRGCFIDISSVIIAKSVLAGVGGFRAHLRYVEDYDLWLRVARSYGLERLAEPLTRRRLHGAQFTRRHHAVALAEESALLRPLLEDRRYSSEVKRALRRYLFGQHKARFAGLARQKRFGDAARAFAGAFRYPAPLLRFLMSVSGTYCPPLRSLKRRLWATGQRPLQR